jgi:tetratricopeptide (TPR) repeat protein
MATLDIDAMWDFAKPAESELRFRSALEKVQGDDALILRTQVARTYSLRDRFDEAHRELDIVEPLLPSAKTAEPKVRALLERGRTLRSAKQPVQARPLFVLAFDAADKATPKLENLAADALHMIALVEPDTQERIEWHRRTIAYARSASDPKARNWEAPALNNLGVTLNDAGGHAEALPVFEQALAIRQKQGKPEAIRVARWMVAHTLRLLKRTDEALAMQLQLEREWAATGDTDPYVFEELALLYDAKGDPGRAAAYRDKHKRASQRARRAVAVATRPPLQDFRPEWHCRTATRPGPWPRDLRPMHSKNRGLISLISGGQSCRARQAKSSIAKRGSLRPKAVEAPQRRSS